MRSRMTRRHRHCVQARRLLFTYTMATIQASFANAAKFFNSLLGLCSGQGKPDRDPAPEDRQRPDCSRYG